MRKLVFFTIIVFFAAMTYGQQKKATISFTENTHDFSTIKEENGPVTYKFELTNTGGEPLIINNVQASCGCTTPDWTREPIPPGKKGFVAATYNPQGRPGEFNKTVTITSNAEEATKVLTIKGKVEPKPKSEIDNYPQSFGELRVTTNHVAFIKILNTEIKSDTVKMYNPTAKNIKVAFGQVPEHITIKAIPEVLQGTQKGIIVVTYDAKKKNDWGFISDRVSVILNDSANSEYRLSFSANIEEDFTKLTDKERENAPKIEFENTTFNFDTIKQGESTSHEFIFKNTGKTDLQIRKTKASCGCTASNPEDNLVKAGATSKIKATFNSSGKSGPQNKTITVTTNDPTNNSIVLKIVGTVIAPAANEGGRPVPPPGK